MLKEDMNSGEKRCRLVGDYILGPKIGRGSFAVVWRSRHRSLGHEVAIKEIDKKQLSSTSNSSKINDSLLKEISILSRIRHPNIVRLHEAIETADKIFLVLECCVGGDLAAYIQRFGRVSEAVARHFMRQLASGLQVLRENNLIHRDLKPQNLLLSTKDETPILKIGDFGFARYLTPQGLADTLCGSPLYMAPEIIQNQKYDAKADLWSVGAIFFQLVTGRPPFDGNNQFQLFQNILKSNELQFPQGVMEELHPDCIDLCKSLLRRNPVERLTFEEFFNHTFMADPRPTVGVEYSSVLLERIPDEQGEGLTDDKLPLTFDKRPQLHSSLLSHVSGRYPELISSTPSSDENVLTERGQSRNDHVDKASTSGDRGGVQKCMLAFQDESVSKSIDCSSSKISDQGSLKTRSVEQGILSMSTMKVADSLELIEREYVVVNAHFALTGSLSSSLEASVRDSSEAQSSNHPLKTTDESVGASVPIRTRELYLDSICGVESLGSNKSVPLAASQASTKSIDVQDTSSLNPSTRLRSLHQYVLVLSELAQEKLNAQMPLEAFSIELVALALWKEALHVCSSWVTHCADREPLRSSSNECPPNQENTYLSLNLAENVDFNSPASVFSWAEHGFIVSFDRAEKISKYLQEIDGGAEMPDAMEIIFQAALAAGKNGAVDELMGNRSSAAALYSKATILLSFILAEASSLPLKPPFSLNVSDQQRIQRYIFNLKAHLSNQKCYTHLHFKAP